ncbi:phospholipase A2-like isoform X2 [Coccinella septempunctata]|nr:phospholipase A2-like isoform X2 [Coccinella septempunctata]
MECYSSIDNIPKASDRLDQSGIPDFKLIFPGTKWCGDGDIAQHDDDLGIYREADKCCRAHDKCFDFIPSGESKHNLTNADQVSRMHCDCDLEFYYCLKNVSSMESIMIGKIYFNDVGKCYKRDYPIIRCLSYKNFLFFQKCLVYELDESKEKVYQYFDLPYFI